jgi:uncharacterized protein YbjT (DUF2867 family)
MFMQTIAIVGASGFIGKELISHLLEHTSFGIRALSRSELKSESTRVSWQYCDLFSVLDVEKGLVDVSAIIYLVHSMQPSARLDQASFDDYDLLLADNLGRAAKKLGIQRVIYLGGLLPESASISRHLSSRAEVEIVLKQYIPSYTFLRAGLVLGKWGSSFHILLNLVKRLFILICPNWTQNLTSPVLVEEVLASIKYCLEHDETTQKTYDLGSYDNITYMQLMQYVAKSLGRNRILIPVRISFLLLSRLWVSLITGAPRQLVYPLIESLEYSLLPRNDHRLRADVIPLYSAQEAIAKTANVASTIKYKFSTRKILRKTVRSVQRSPLPKGAMAIDVAKEYMLWLPDFMRPLILVLVSDDLVTFNFFHPKFCLLKLKYSSERSTIDRQIFYIQGGLLAGKQDRGRLEFRTVLNHEYALFAIHDFTPALPWFIYRYTQALIHLIVMYAFASHLDKIKNGERNWIKKS